MNGKFSYSRAILASRQTSIVNALWIWPNLCTIQPAWNGRGNFPHPGNGRAIMKKPRRNRITTWGMMGLLVVGLTVWCALPARAVPIDYTFVFSGGGSGFTIDDTLAQPYIAWNISYDGGTWNNLTDTSTPINITLQPGRFELNTISFGTDNLYLFTNFIGDPFGPFAGISWNCPGGSPCDNFFYVFPRPSIIPEPPSWILFPIGLLVLAGARWWTHRQERLQWGCPLPPTATITSRHHGRRFQQALLVA